MSFSLPTDVQAEAIPMILGGGDVLMVSMFLNLYFLFVESCLISIFS